MAGEEVTTIFVAGLSIDVLPRELDNLCRFLPGFVSQTQPSKQRGQTLFVLFDSQESCHFAIGQLNGKVFDRGQPGEPMRVQMAKNNMNKTYEPSAYGKGKGGSPGPTWGFGGAPQQQPLPQMGHPGMGMGAKGRPRTVEDPNQVDTVACVGADSSGWDEGSLRAFFEACPGFTDFKANNRLGGGFAKFASPQHAQQAVQAAGGQGIPAEMARNSMSIGGQPPAGMVAGPVSLGGNTMALGGMAMPFSAGMGAKRPRSSCEDPNQVDTVVSQGADTQGLDESSLRLVFESFEGFVAFRGNSKIGGGFAKFASPPLASNAAQMAKGMGIPCEIARNSMTIAA